MNTGNEQDVVSEKDVPEVPLRYPIYDDMGFPDYGLDMYWRVIVQDEEGEENY